MCKLPRAVFMYQGLLHVVHRVHNVNDKLHLSFSTTIPTHRRAERNVLRDCYPANDPPDAEWAPCVQNKYEPVYITLGSIVAGSAVGA